MPRTIAYRAGGFTNCRIGYTKFSQEELAEMKDGIHGNREQIEELSATKILRELYDQAKFENDGKVHIRAIKNGHVGETVESY